MSEDGGWCEERGFPFPNSSHQENNLPSPMTLGIWIPSWDRDRFFNRLVETIEPQQHTLLKVACGLNPPTNSYSVPPWMEEIRHERNIGQSLNILYGLSALDTDYLWVLGDDEQLKPGAVSEILELIQERPGMVICTDGRFDHGPEGDYPDWTEWADACVNSDRGVMLTAQTLISATVFRRQGFDMETAINFIDTKYGHHFGMLNGLLKEPVRVTRRPVFTAGHNSDSHIHDELEEIRSTHGARCRESLTYLIHWINEQTQRNYSVAECYHPGVGFDS